MMACLLKIYSSKLTKIRPSITAIWGTSYCSFEKVYRSTKLSRANIIQTKLMPVNSIIWVLLDCLQIRCQIRIHVSLLSSAKTLHFSFQLEVIGLFG
jgi:hypothetical protein